MYLSLLLLLLLYNYRYRELYSENSVKNFSEAEKYYERAALMFPNSGNAQNQVLYKTFFLIRI